MNNLSTGKKIGIAVCVIVVILAVAYYFDVGGYGKWVDVKLGRTSEKLSTYPYTGTFYDIYNRKTGSVR